MGVAEGGGGEVGMGWGRMKRGVCGVEGLKDIEKWRKGG